MIEDHPRHLVDDIQEPMTCHLLVQFGRGTKKVLVGDEVVLPPDEVQDYTHEQIPTDYAVVTVTWNVPEYEEYEMEYPTRHGVKFLGQATCAEVLWNKNDIELIPQTPMPTPTLVSQPSVAGSSPPNPDDGGGDDEGNGEDDKGKNGGQGTSPPPLPPNSLSLGPSNAAGGSEAAPGEKTTSASQPSTSCPPPSSPPPGSLPTGMSKGPGGTKAAPGVKTQPAASQPSTSQCPPTPRKPTDAEEEAIPELACSTCI